MTRPPSVTLLLLVLCAATSPAWGLQGDVLDEAPGDDLGGNPVSEVVVIVVRFMVGKAVGREEVMGVLDRVLGVAEAEVEITPNGGNSNVRVTVECELNSCGYGGWKRDMEAAGTADFPVSDVVVSSSAPNPPQEPETDSKTAPWYLILIVIGLAMLTCATIVGWFIRSRKGPTSPPSALPVSTPDVDATPFLYSPHVELEMTPITEPTPSPMSPFSLGRGKVLAAPPSYMGRGGGYTSPRGGVLERGYF